MPINYASKINGFRGIFNTQIPCNGNIIQNICTKKKPQIIAAFYLL